MAAVKKGLVSSLALFGLAALLLFAAVVVNSRSGNGLPPRASVASGMSIIRPPGGPHP
jgi:HAMP domain-containing protein